MQQHIDERQRDDKGFTLIELMVVVLIMGILMAIAIPTFLSTRGSANDASAKSNATNVFTNEKSYYASNQSFFSANSVTEGETFDDTLPWGDPTTAKGTVASYGGAVTSGTYSGAQYVEVEAYSQSGNCYSIVDFETQSSAVIGYYSQNSKCSGAIAYTAPPANTAGASAGAPSSTALSSSSNLFSAW